MEEINGVTFRDYACASANLAAGMSEEEVSKVLGIEIPVWQETIEKWNAKMAELSHEDMAFFGEVFANPKQGKFATTQSDIPSLDELLQNVPDYNAYKKIFWHQSVAAQHGIDAVTIIESYGLNLQTWSQLNMHFMKWHTQYMDADLGETNPDEYNKRYQEITAIEQNWKNHWTEHYKDNAVDLSGDIDF